MPPEHSLSGQILNAIVQASPLPIYTLNLEGIVLSWNPACERLYGWTADQVLGSFSPIVPEEEKPSFVTLMRSIADGTPLLHHEVQRLRADGTPIELSISASPLRDSSGVAIGVVAIAVDISFRKRAESVMLEENWELDDRVRAHTAKLADANLAMAREIEERLRIESELRKSERRFRGIFENSVDGIFQTTPEGAYLQVNPALARIYGYNFADDLKQHLNSIATQLYVDSTRRDDFLQLMERDGTVHGFESEIYRKDGSKIWISETSRVVTLCEGKVLYYEGTVSDITDRRLAQEALQKSEVRLRTKLAQMTALRAIDIAINSSHDYGRTLGVCLNRVCEQLHVDAATVLLIDEPTHSLRCAASQGIISSTITQMWLPLEASIAGDVVIRREMVRVPNLKLSSARLVRGEALIAEGMTCYYGMPLIAKGRVLGVLEVMSRAPVEPDDEWYGFYETLAGQAAIAVDNSMLFDGLQRSNEELVNAYDATIEGWSRALDLRDHETEGHTQRVTEMTMLMAKRRGIGELELIQIRRGALLHDIGKMGVPDSILLKPGPLTEEEWEVMRRHPQYARDMLAPIEFLRPAIEIPFCHHEKWDGSGYPRKLKGEEIPLAARLFSVVDVWDALRSNRPYRSGWSEERVREHIRSLSGTHFDPKSVDLYLEISSELDGVQLRGTSDVDLAA